MSNLTPVNPSGVMAAIEKIVQHASIGDFETVNEGVDLVESALTDVFDRYNHLIQVTPISAEEIA